MGQQGVMVQTCRGQVAGEHGGRTCAHNNKVLHDHTGVAVRSSTGACTLCSITSLQNRKSRALLDSWERTSKGADSEDSQMPFP